MILPFSTQLKCVTTCPRGAPEGFNQASYYIPISPYPPVHPPGNPKATRRPPTWPAVAFSAFVPQSLKQKNPKCPKTADTEKSPNHHQPTILTWSCSCEKTLFKCARENSSTTAYNSNFGSPGLSRFCSMLPPHCLELLGCVRANME